jgi:hypothetical protein
VRKIIRRRIRHSGGGINLAADINVVIATGEGTQGVRTTASSHQHVRSPERDEAERPEAEAEPSNKEDDV